MDLEENIKKRKKVINVIIYYKTGEVDIFGRVKIKFHKDHIEIIEEKKEVNDITLIKYENIEKYKIRQQKNPGAN